MANMFSIATTPNSPEVFQWKGTLVGPGRRALSGSGLCANGA